MKSRTFLCFAATLAAFAVGASLHAADFVAHEWGTFTSVQGSGGGLLAWNPFETADLPEFVHTRTLPDKNVPPGSLPLLFSKNEKLWLQRMETPVIYFYTAQPLILDVAVEFPDGELTEWYPQVGQFGPTPAIANRFAATEKSLLRWDRVHLDPAAASADLPAAQPGNHYFAARETDAVVVRTGAGAAWEDEKFLFYRGAGNFSTPLVVSFSGERDIKLENSGKEHLHPFFVLEVRHDGAAFVRVKGLAPSATKKLELPESGAFRPILEVANELGAALVQGLISEGLYPREAAAMVKTWRDSWFTEPGVRVLYLLPRGWTDRTLPLTITPKPRELVRVMVGRAEVFTPAVERELRAQFTLFADPNTHSRAVANAQALRLGRFAEPAMTRVAELEKQEIQKRANQMKAALRPLPTFVPGTAGF